MSLSSEYSLSVLLPLSLLRCLTFLPVTDVVFIVVIGFYYVTISVDLCSFPC